VFREGHDQMMALGKTFGWWLLHEDSDRALCPLIADA
jgi:hypothetical protein